MGLPRPNHGFRSLGATRHDYRACMAGLTKAERERLTQVVARRLGARSDAADLATAYLEAAERHAFARTCEPGPVPTTLNVERSAVLIEISRGLKRVINDFEIQALFRVTAAQAKAMRTTLLAMYSDDTDELTLAWSLEEARTLGRLDVGAFTGTEIQFNSKERRDSFLAQNERAGVKVEVLLGDEARPWRAAVGDAFPKANLPSLSGK